jgi:phosphoribosylamine--glycine ligase
VSPKRILVVGAGGREHALAWRLARDPEAPEVLLAPGNDGIARAFSCMVGEPADPAGLIALAREREVDLVVIGPEAPLADGLADAFSDAGLLVLGPTKDAARLESSKGFAKEILREAGVPTARAETFTHSQEAQRALSRFGPPYVVKADGLAAGKGVRVTADRAEADRFISDCLERGRYGVAGECVLIEQFLTGEEASVMAVCDGERFLLLPAARDYKRALDGDRGPNTGGMGAVAPAPMVSAALEEQVGRRVVGPVLQAMAARGTPFRGVLYCGLMIVAGEPRVLEFNVRFGDPEAEAVLPLLDGSLARLLASAAQGALDAKAVSRAAGAAVVVTLVDRDYPDAVSGDGVIVSLEEAERRPGVVLFHAGTAHQDGAWRVRGGRAVHLMAQDANVETAREHAYAAIATLGGRGWRCRSDIAAQPVRSGAWANQPERAGNPGSRA